jgi:hypothetical protein
LDTILEAINRRRRHFLGASAATVAAAQLGMVGSAAAQIDETKAVKSPAVKPGTNTSFGLLRQVDAGDLSVGYVEAGPADGPAVGGSAWRKAIRSWRIWRSGWLPFQSLPFRPSPWREMSMALRIRTPAPTLGSSLADTSTGPSRAASGTICPRKRRTPLRKPSSM